MSAAIYRLIPPQGPRVPVVVSVPHSGRDYRPGFLAQTRLGAQAIRSSEDAFVDELVAGAALAGMPVLIATRPRAWLDLNRAPDELDPAVIEGLPPPARALPRVASGLGVIPRVVGGSRAIYEGKIPRAEAEARLREGWHPFHAELKRLVSETRASFGSCLLIDCHSMPDPGPGCADVVVGDRYGASAAPEAVARVEAALRAEQFTTARNIPFAGAYICAHYGQPRRGIHAVQLEINRSLYMHEPSLTPHEGFAPLARRLTQMFHRLAAPEALKLAAE